MIKNYQTKILESLEDLIWECSWIIIGNKLIKASLRPFIFCKKNNNIDWIYFIGFLIEENEYKSKIIEKMNNEENKICLINEKEEENISEEDQDCIENKKKQKEKL